MADAAAAPAADEPSDEAAHSAAGLRSTSQWIAGAFAGIPSLAVIGALVRAPGERGFDDGYLIAGVALAALGALIGILAFARVRKPVGLADYRMSPGVVARLPEARFQSYDALRQRLEQQRDLVGAKQVSASDASGLAKAAEARAAQAEAAAKLADELLGKEDPPDPDKKQEAKLARRVAREARAEAGVAAAGAAVHEKDLELSEMVMESLDGLRRGAYGLQASDVVAERYDTANRWAVVAVALVAAGVIFLALAPKPKEEEAKAVAPSLVRLTLSEAGQAALGCKATEVDALKVGGDAKAPTVVVLPGSDCPAQTVEFVTEDPTKLGKVVKARAFPTE